MARTSEGKPNTTARRRPTADTVRHAEAAANAVDARQAETAAESESFPSDAGTARDAPATRAASTATISVALSRRALDTTTSPGSRPTAMASASAARANAACRTPTPCSTNATAPGEGGAMRAFARESAVTLSTTAAGVTPPSRAQLAPAPAIARAAISRSSPRNPRILTAVPGRFRGP